MNVSGGVFQAAEYYTTNELSGMDEVRRLVPHADDLNWLFVGTSGVHGSYADCDDALEALREDGEAWLTVVVLQPRMVRTFFGHLPVEAGRHRMAARTRGRDDPGDRGKRMSDTATATAKLHLSKAVEALQRSEEPLPRGDHDLIRVYLGQAKRETDRLLLLRARSH